MLNQGNEIPVEQEVVGSIVVLRFCLPKQKNTLSTRTLNYLAEILAKLREDTSVRAIVITGSEDVFLSGADIRELATLDAEGARVFSQKGQALTQTIADLKAPTIAAINGYCMGGGLDFALACDVRIASKTAVFAHPGSRLGIITGWGGTQRLPRLIGRTKAIELFSTARRITSEEALKTGLITKIADPVLEAAMELAMTFVSTS